MFRQRISPSERFASLELEPSMFFALPMYEIPGTPELTRRALARYVQDKKSQDGGIQELVRAKQHSSDDLERRRKRISDYHYEMLKKLRAQPQPEKQAALVRDGLTSGDPERAQASLHMTDELDLEFRAPLVALGLSATEPSVRHASACAISGVSKENAVSLYQIGLNMEDPEVRKICIDQFIYLRPSDDLLRPILEVCLQSRYSDVQRIPLAFFPSLPKDFQEKVRAKVLSLLHNGLENPDPKEQAAWIAEADLKSLDDPRLWEKVSRIAQARLETNTPPVSERYFETLWRLPEQLRLSLQEKVAGMIRASLETSDPRRQIERLALLEFLPEAMKLPLQKKVTDVVRKDLARKGDPSVKKSIAWLIEFALPEEKSRLLALAKKRLGDALVEPPLYKDATFAGNRLFPREPFAKTGSETTLIGGTLEGKMIVRRINPEAFLAWQRLFENHALWKNTGFNYVPIEPILSYRLREDGLVDVSAGVLDLNLRLWLKMGGDFEKALKQKSSSIQSILKQQGIDHHHPHWENFVLRFFRDRKGHVDFKREPRIYLIDFDLATFSSRASQ